MYAGRARPAGHGTMTAPAAGHIFLCPFSGAEWEYFQDEMSAGCSFCGCFNSLLRQRAGNKSEKP